MPELVDFGQSCRFLSALWQLVNCSKMTKNSQFWPKIWRFRNFYKTFSVASSRKLYWFCLIKLFDRIQLLLSIFSNHVDFVNLIYFCQSCYLSQFCCSCRFLSILSIKMIYLCQICFCQRFRQFVSLILSNPSIFVDFVFFNPANLVSLSQFSCSCRFCQFCLQML